MSVLALVLLAQLAVTDPVRVVDGDTFDVGPVRYRLANVDAPEMSGRCPAERALARQARAELQRLLAAGEVRVEVTDRQPATARYRDRLIARVTAGGQDVGAALLAAGVARPYRRSAPSWCETAND